MIFLIISCCWNWFDHLLLNIPISFLWYIRRLFYRFLINTKIFFIQIKIQTCRFPKRKWSSWERRIIMKERRRERWIVSEWKRKRELSRLNKRSGIRWFRNKRTNGLFELEMIIFQYTVLYLIQQHTDNMLSK